MSKKLVSIFVGGVQKSGTRSVSELFRKNPHCSLHQTKEGHFFDKDEIFNGLIPDTTALCTYHKGFYQTAQTEFLCDVSPDYIFRENVVSRIHAYNPSANWIILLRNPLDRAFSAWNMEVNRKTETLSFEAALYSELNGQPKDRSHDRFAYIGRSQYHRQLERLWQYFPKSHCHILPAEQVWHDPEKSLYRILSSLGVTGFQEMKLTHAHKGTYRKEISTAANELLQTELAFEFNELSDLLGWDHNPWIE